MLLLVIKMTKEELRMKINKIRWDLDNSYLHREDAIREWNNTLIDYWNETQDREYDYYTNTFESADMLEDYIRYRMETFWPSQVARDLKNLDSDDDYYKIDDVYWDISTVSDWDVMYWLEEILDDIWAPSDEFMEQKLEERLKFEVEVWTSSSMDDLYYQAEVFEDELYGYEFDWVHWITEALADKNWWFIDEDDK